MRKWLIKILKGVPEEDVPLAQSWEALLESRNASPVWHSIVGSRLWIEELKPWLEKMLVQTLFQLVNERDERVKTELQIQAQMLNRFLETPAKEKARGDMMLEQSYLRGDDVMPGVGGR